MYLKYWCKCLGSVERDYALTDKISQKHMVSSFNFFILFFNVLVCFSFFKIRELVPESQAYMDLLAFERKLDQTIMRKRLDIQEALKRPIKVCYTHFHYTNLTMVLFSKALGPSISMVYSQLLIASFLCGFESYF